MRSIWNLSNKFHCINKSRKETHFFGQVYFQDLLAFTKMYFRKQSRGYEYTQIKNGFCVCEGLHVRVYENAKLCAREFV